MFGDPRLPARFWRKVSVNDAGCWEWVAAKSAGGYGVMGINKNVHYTHRLAYVELVGPVPAGLELDHLCRVRHCCNPAHLEPVTSQENTRRGESAAATIAYHYAKTTHCPHGHAYSGTNLYNPPGTSQRICRTCMRAAKVRYREKLRLEGPRP